MTQSRYSICITDEATEMPRCFSISIQSEVAWREALRAFTELAIWIAPENSSSFLRQRGLAGVGVGDDGEGAAAPHLRSEIGHGAAIIPAGPQRGERDVSLINIHEPAVGLPNT